MAGGIFMEPRTKQKKKIDELNFLGKGHCCRIYIENIITFSSQEGFVVAVHMFFKILLQIWSSFHLVLHMELSVLNLLFQWFRYHISHILQKTSGSLFPWDIIKSVTGTADSEERAGDFVEGCWSLQSSVYVAKNDTWNLCSEVSSKLAQLSDDRQMHIVYK